MQSWSARVWWVIHRWCSDQKAGKIKSSVPCLRAVRMKVSLNCESIAGRHAGNELSCVHCRLDFWFMWELVWSSHLLSLHFSWTLVIFGTNQTRFLDNFMLQVFWCFCLTPWRLQGMILPIHNALSRTISSQLSWKQTSSSCIHQTTRQRSSNTGECWRAWHVERYMILSKVFLFATYSKVVRQLWAVKACDLCERTGWCCKAVWCPLIKNVLRMFSSRCKCWKNSLSTHKHNFWRAL